MKQESEEFSEYHALHMVEVGKQTPIFPTSYIEAIVKEAILLHPVHELHTPPIKWIQISWHLSIRNCSTPLCLEPTNGP